MKKQLFVFLCSIISFTSITQSLQSPEQFLGYKIGTHYTPHFKMVNYVKAVALARPDVVKIEKYGETNEGRELLLAYITSPQNLRRLDEIRKNNLRVAGTSKDKIAATETNVPAIVWLSYNVHGNETSSSESAML